MADQTTEAPEGTRPRTAEEKAAAHVEKAHDEEAAREAAKGRAKAFKDVPHVHGCPADPMRMEEDEVYVPPSFRPRFGDQEYVGRLRCQDCGAEALKVGRKTQPVRE